jgi:predicted ATPase
MSRSDLVSAEHVRGTIFFDRGLIDAAVALQFTCDISLEETIGSTRPYNKTVFLAPPWPEIYQNDEDRRHDLETAMDEYDRLAEALNTLNYKILLLPKVSIEDRVEFVLDRL